MNPALLPNQILTGFVIVVVVVLALAFIAVCFAIGRDMWRARRNQSTKPLSPTEPR